MEMSPHGDWGSKKLAPLNLDLTVGFLEIQSMIIEGLVGVKLGLILDHGMRIVSKGCSDEG